MNLAFAASLHSLAISLVHRHVDVHQQSCTCHCLGCPLYPMQEPGSNAEIKQCAREKFSTSFDLFSKVQVNGSGTLPLYRWLKSKALGIAGTPALPFHPSGCRASISGARLARLCVRLLIAAECCLSLLQAPSQSRRGLQNEPRNHQNPSKRVAKRFKKRGGLALLLVLAG